MTIRITGELEIDKDRGVIYFHTDNKRVAMDYGSVSILRICRLPTPIPEQAMDITHMHGCNWKSEEDDKSTKPNLQLWGVWPLSCSCGCYVGRIAWQLEDSATTKWVQNHISVRRCCGNTGSLVVGEIVQHTVNDNPTHNMCWLTTDEYNRIESLITKGD